MSKTITDGCFLLLVVACVFACQTPSPVVPSPDASDASADAELPLDAAQAEAKACAAMVRAGCVVLPTCPSVIRHINSLPKNFDHIDVPCLEGAKTYQDVEKCGASCDLTKE